MRLLKPLRLSFVHRVFDQRKKHFLVATVGYAVRFDAPRAPVMEPEMWKALGTELGRFGVADHWMFKPQAELLVTGSCFTGERPKGSEFVRVQLCTPMNDPPPDAPFLHEDRRRIDKKLYVFGDRRWTLIGPSEPQMFTRMPVDYAHAFGGPGSRENPIGRGLVPTKDESGAEQHLLPNVESPKHQLKSKGDRPPPASMTAWDLTWPVHFEKKMGSYGKDWVEKNGFALADDVDFSLFNVAPPDQRLDDFFTGGEEIRVENMHPDKRVQDLRLPGFRGRAFVRFVEAHAGERKGLVEVPLRADTIHLLPHRELALVFFRGVIEIHTTDATDVELCLAALEDGSEQKPLEHYERVLALRLDKDRGALHSLRDRDLMPTTCEVSNSDGIKVGDPLEDVLLPPGALQANLHRRVLLEYEARKEELIAQGVDPALIPPPPAEPPPPTQDLEALPELVEALEGERAQAEADVARAKADTESQLEALCKEHGIDLEAARAARQSDKHGPPRFDVEEEIQKLEDLAALEENAGIEVPGVRAQLSDPNLRARLLEVQRQLHEAYRIAAHLQEAADASTPEESEAARALLAEVLGGAPRGRRDFTGVDLSGAVLRGIELEGAFLEGAKLVGTDLSGARLRDVVLARADLTNAKLDHADLTRANLGRAVLRGASLDGAVLTDAVLHEADVSGARFVGATLTRANTFALTGEGADFSNVVAEQLLFYKAKLPRAVLKGARITTSVFAECDVTGLEASSADLSHTVFLQCSGDESRFVSARLENLRLVLSSFERADFTNAFMPGSNLRGAKLAGAKFAGANLRRSDLSTADLRGADLFRGIGVESLFLDTNLEGARLTGANLMLAIMHRAVLRGADVSEANLFCADLTGAIGDAKTSFTNTNVKRALVAGVFHG